MPRTSAVGRRGEGPLRVAVAPAARKPHEAIGTYEFSRMWLMDFLACKLALALWSVYILTTMVVPSSSGRHFFSASNTLSNSNSVHVYLVWVTLQTFEAYPTAYSLPVSSSRCARHTPPARVLESLSTKNCFVVSGSRSTG
jgi:hypothetical protein